VSNINLTEKNARRYLGRIKENWSAKYPNEEMEGPSKGSPGIYLYIPGDVANIHFEWVVWFQKPPEGFIEVGLHFETEKEKDKDKNKINNLLILNTMEQYGKVGKITLLKGIKFDRKFPSITWATRIHLLTEFVSAYDTPSIKWAFDTMEAFRKALEPGLIELKKEGIIP